MKKKFGIEKSIYLRISAVMFMLIIDIITAICIINLNINSFNIWLIKFSILSLSHVVINIIFLKLLGEKIYSLSSMFLIFSYIFHFGQTIIYAFNINVTIPFSVIDRVSIYNYIHASIFSFLVQNSIIIGMLIIWAINLNNKCKISLNVKERLDYFYKLGIIFTVVGFIPTIYLDINRIILYFTGGYLNTYDLDGPGLLSTIASFFDYGIIMILIGKKKNQKLCRNIVLFIMLYKIFTMISGNRGKTVVSILVLIYVYINVIKSLNLKNILYYISFGYLGVVLINAIGITRNYNITNLNSALTVLGVSFSESPIFKVLAEFGGTLITVCYSLIYFPQYAPIQYGVNYLSGIFMIFPNIGGVLNSFINNIIYVDNIPGEARLYLGGSYIGELYYSFNLYGIAFAIIIGVLIGLISRKTNDFIRNKQYFKFMICIFFFSNIIWWVRGYFGSMIREIVWPIIFIYIIKITIKKSL